MGGKCWGGGGLTKVKAPAFKPTNLHRRKIIRGGLEYRQIEHGGRDFRFKWERGSEDSGEDKLKVGFGYMTKPDGNPLLCRLTYL